VKEKETITTTTPGAADEEKVVVVSKKTTSKQGEEEDYVAGSPAQEEDADDETNDKVEVDEENPTKKDNTTAADDDDASDSHPTVDEEEMDDVCAICIEHFRKLLYLQLLLLCHVCFSFLLRTSCLFCLSHTHYTQTHVTEQDEFVMEGLECHHEYHRSCMMEWLVKHNDCPVCRKSMWTRDAFAVAKKQVLKKNPQLVKTEMEAAQAVEDTMETAAAGARNLAAANAGDDNNDVEYDEENLTGTVTALASSGGGVL
jgi:hypothetical protein